MLAVLAGRLAYIQLLAGDEYLQAGELQRKTFLELPQPRGEILDFFGCPLAYSEPGFDVWVDPSELRGNSELAAQLSAVLGQYSLDIEQKLSSSKSAFRAARAISIEQADALQGLGLSGVRLIPVHRRVYPLASACAQLVGCVGDDGFGLEGLELAWDDALAAKPGRRELGSDALHRKIDLPDSRELPGQGGVRLVLTLDAGMQRVVFEEMSKAASELQPLGGSAIVLECSTGDVRALVSWPSFDPARRISASHEEALCRPIQCAYEPGSTFKPFVLSWAVEKGLARPGELIDCEGGHWQPLEGRIIHDARPRGVVPLEDVLVYSSNIGAAKIGRRLGPDRLFECVRAFGFGEKTKVGFPGESPGLVGSRTTWSPHTVISVPFGQELAVTPLQLATGYAALVNGGLRVRPRLIDRLEDEGGRLLHQYARAAPERLISPETSNWVVQVLTRAVEQSLPRWARTEGVKFGGKTGTAQKYERDPSTGRLRPSATKVVASFVGFAPAERPELVCLVMWDEPAKLRGGGVAAAPVVARIFGRIFSKDWSGGGS